MKEASNFEALIAFQHEELSLYKDEKKLRSVEKRGHTMMMQKMVERLCPKVDPAEKNAYRKQELDELCDMHGEVLYQAKLLQLKEEYMKASVF
jgi:hypothetical protein